MSPTTAIYPSWRNRDFISSDVPILIRSCIIINVKIDYNIKSKDKSGTFTISKRGNYVVQDQYSETIIQERSLIDNLSDKIVGEIRENLSKLTYDS